MSLWGLRIKNELVAVMGGDVASPNELIRISQMAFINVYVVQPSNFEEKFITKPRDIFPTLSESIDNALQLVGIPKIIGPIVEARERGKKLKSSFSF